MIILALHSYAFDCVSHHLFHPYGSNSLQNSDDEAVMREVAFDSSLQSKSILAHPEGVNHLLTVS